jgi:hypothetical protein
VLDGGKDLFDFVFRRRGTHDEDQIVQTLFHVMTSFLLFPGRARETLLAPLCGLAGLKTRHYWLG